MLENATTVIEFTAYDEDMEDTLNWTVVSVEGLPANPAGSRLMEDLPAFNAPNPTLPDLNRVHKNRMTITPEQPKTNEKDEYRININLSDGKHNGNVEFTFNVRVQNINDPPYVVTPPSDISMSENSSGTVTAWRLTDIFKDPDREAGIAEENLMFCACLIAGPPIGIELDGEMGLVSLEIPDYAFSGITPISWECVINLMATDAGSGDHEKTASSSIFAKLHIEHMNHEPFLGKNATDLLEYGLTWMEDTSYARLDLNDVFRDVDIQYAEDFLTFKVSGDNHISVNDTAGMITLTPERDWFGRETIKFKATDSNSQSVWLNVECEVLPVNDAPFFCETEMDIAWDDETDLVINETTGPAGALTKLVLDIAVKDPDPGDHFFCSWYVYNALGKSIYRTRKPVENVFEYEFRCNWTGPFSAAESPYELKVVVQDLDGAEAVYTWNVTVNNVDRPPSIRCTSPKNDSTFVKGEIIFFNAWESNDPDEPKENLIFTWASNRQGIIQQDRGRSGAQFEFSKLKPGKHIIELSISDSDGDETTQTITITIAEPSAVPGFETISMIVLSVIGCILVAGKRKKLELGANL